MQLDVTLHTSPSSVRLSKKPRSIDIMTPVCLLAWLESYPEKSAFVSLSLVLCEGLELLNETYELAVSVLLRETQTHPVRWVGISDSLNDTQDLAQWLNVSPDNIYDFRPSERGQPLSTTSQSFTIPPSPALFKAMIKPAHTALKGLSSPQDAAIVFVPSRGQCRSVCTDLITQCAIEMDTRGFLGVGVEDLDYLEARLAQMKDRSLVDAMMHGIGLFIPPISPGMGGVPGLGRGMDASDRIITLELFAEGVLRVLVVPREACWTLPLRASLVLIMGTQYFEITGPPPPPLSSNSLTQRSHHAGPEPTNRETKSKTNTNMSKPHQHQQHQHQHQHHNQHRTLKEYSMHELVRMQGLAVQGGSKIGRFHLFCQAEQRDTYMRFLEEGLPLESSLLSSLRSSTSASSSSVLQPWLAARRSHSTSSAPSQTIRGKQDLLDLLSYTFLWKRMRSNPTYYDVIEGGDMNGKGKSRDAVLSRFVDQLFELTNVAKVVEDVKTDGPIAGPPPPGAM